MSIQCQAYALKCLIYFRFRGPRFRFTPRWSLRSPKPRASNVLTAYLRKRQYPSWTAFYVRRWEVTDDQKWQSHFNHNADGVNYHVLRTTCYPFVKYHCTKRPPEDLSMENRLYLFIKLINLGKYISLSTIRMQLFIISPLSLRHSDHSIRPLWAAMGQSSGICLR